MKVIYNLLLILSVFFLSIIFFEWLPGSQGLAFAIHFPNFLRIALYSSHSIEPVFSSRTLAFICYLLFFFLIGKNKRNRADWVLFFFSVTGILAEFFNLMNILYWQKGASLMHWDLLMIFVLSSRFIQLREQYQEDIEKAEEPFLQTN